MQRGSFLALYRGETVGSARLVAVSADPKIVREFAERLLDEEPDPCAVEPDPVGRALEGGRRDAIRLVRDEAADAEGGSDEDADREGSP